MKNILIVIAVAVLLVGGFLLFAQNEAGDEAGNEINSGNNANGSESTTNTDGEMNDDAESGVGVSGEVDLSVDLGEADVVVDVSGTNFAFDVTEIRVQEGDVVTINFTSESGFHDWVVDAFRANTERVRDGGSSSVTFVASKAGTYEYYCSVGQHRAQGMVGTLVVE